MVATIVSPTTTSERLSALESPGEREHCDDDHRGDDAIAIQRHALIGGQRVRRCRADAAQVLAAERVLHQADRHADRGEPEAGSGSPIFLGRRPVSSGPKSAPTLMPM